MTLRVQFVRYFVGVIMVLFCVSNKAKPYATVSLLYPPYMISPSRAQAQEGFLIEFARDVFKEAGEDIQVDFLPSGRSIKMFVDGHYQVGLFARDSFPSANEHFIMEAKFIPLIAFKLHYFYHKIDRERVLDEQGGIIFKGNATAIIKASYDEYRFLEAKGVREINSVNSVEQLVNLFMRKRVDFIQTTPDTLRYFSKNKEKMILDNTAMISRPSIEGYAGIMLHPSIKHSEKLKNKLDDARLKLLRKNGYIDSLISKYSIDKEHIGIPN
jgi:hypothetical protein